jgi:formylglycine-generating enzyme required for sulfatase activity
VILLLGGLAAGLLSLDPNRVANLPTQTPWIMTATLPPVTPTNTPAETTEEPTQGILLEIQAPTASPTIPATLQTLQPTNAPTSATPTGGAALTGQSTGASSRLMDIASELVLIPGGTFQMGTTIAEVTAAVEECLEGYGGEPGACLLEYGEDSYPQHPVTVSPFYLELMEVSYEQFLVFMNEMGAGSHRNGCNGQPCMETRTDSETSNVTFDSANYTVPSVINNFPVTNVTWYGAQAYCEALGRRLPTEAEWERAARGDSGFIYPWGNDWDATRASTSRPAEGENNKVPVDAFPTGATAQGILNMAGNVEEWVSDWYDSRFYSRPEASLTDPTGPAAGSERVVRGGSWDTTPFFARAVHRRSAEPLNPSASLGFRCAADVDAVQNSGGTLPLGSGDAGGGSDLLIPTGTADAATLGTIPGSDEEFTEGNSQPTLPPQPTRVQPTTAAPLDPGA